MLFSFVARMQKGIVILWLSCILLHAGSRVGILLGFEINRDLIAATLCINRDKPEMECKGKCFLASQLKKDKAAERKHIANINELLSGLTLYYESYAAAESSHPIDTPHHISIPDQTPFGQIAPADIFHPPKA